MPRALVSSVYSGTQMPFEFRRAATLTGAVVLLPPGVAGGVTIMKSPEYDGMFDAEFAVRALSAACAEDSVDVLEDGTAGT
jgi:hypothetical protein